MTRTLQAALAQVLITALGVIALGVIALSQPTAQIMELELQSAKGKISKGGWRPVSFDLGEAHAGGSAEDATTRDWEACQWKPRGKRMIVRCPDGFREVN